MPIKLLCSDFCLLIHWKIAQCCYGTHAIAALLCNFVFFYTFSAEEFLFLQWHKKRQRLPTGTKHSPLCHFTFGPERFKHRTLSGSLTLTNGCFLLPYLFFFFDWSDGTSLCARVHTLSSQKSCLCCSVLVQTFHDTWLEAPAVSCKMCPVQISNALHMHDEDKTEL